jgi:hypothetical protein
MDSLARLFHDRWHMRHRSAALARAGLTFALAIGLLSAVGTASLRSACAESEAPEGGCCPRSAPACPSCPREGRSSCPGAPSSPAACRSSEALLRGSSLEPREVPVERANQKTGGQELANASPVIGASEALRAIVLSASPPARILACTFLL